jgi:hypothetical protein
MHIVTVANKNDGYFNYLIESCKRNIKFFVTDKNSILNKLNYNIDCIKRRNNLNYLLTTTFFKYILIIIIIIIIIITIVKI